jgi:hypothetical protein
MGIYRLDELQLSWSPEKAENVKLEAESRTQKL